MLPAGRPMSLAPGLASLGARLGRLRRPALALAPAFALAVAGCYGVDHEIIPAPLGVPVPYIYDSVEWDEGGTTELSPVAYSNDKRFRDVGKDGGVSTGTLRALHIRDDVYAVQADYDDEPCCYIVFYRIGPEDVQGVWPTGDVDALAARHGVTLEFDEVSDYLVGEAGTLLAFIRAHAELDFE